MKVFNHNATFKNIFVCLLPTMYEKLQQTVSVLFFIFAFEFNFFHRSFNFSMSKLFGVGRERTNKLQFYFCQTKQRLIHTKYRRIQTWQSCRLIPILYDGQMKKSVCWWQSFKPILPLSNLACVYIVLETIFHPIHVVFVFFITIKYKPRSLHNDCQVIISAYMQNPVTHLYQEHLK